MPPQNEIKDLLRRTQREIASASSQTEIEKIRVKFLGRKGTLTGILKSLKSLPASERPTIGKLANETKVVLEEALQNRREELAKQEIDAKLIEEAVDITLPGKRPLLGRKHLLSQITDEVVEIFIGLGYNVAEGPEVELDYYNFEALNTPKDHPARSLQDTFYVKTANGKRQTTKGEGRGAKGEEVLLRTHTSPVQIRVMEKRNPPLFIVAPGTCYRRDVADPSHTAMFHQIEGFTVDEGITFGDLKGTLEVFARQLFGEKRKVRLRPHYFPFTEPSIEVDVSCGVCEGKGCRSCGGGGWLEILGAGMIDPAVFETVGYDPERVTGFAFGMGTNRIAAQKYGVKDIRMLYENDVRFLDEF